jgi:hypothetical protein
MVELKFAKTPDHWTAHFYLRLGDGVLVALVVYLVRHKLF